MDGFDRPKSLRETVTQHLRVRIIEADFAFGQLLSEVALAAELGVSKTPVHEALVQLQSEGLVEILPQRGARVFAPDKALVADLVYFRSMLECEALRLAMSEDPAALVRELGEVVGAMADARKANDLRRYLQLDTEYHDQFYRFCGSSHLSAAYARIAGRVAAVRTHLAAPVPDARQVGYQEHLEIVRLLRRGSTAEASAVLKTHVGRNVMIFQPNDMT